MKIITTKEEKNLLDFIPKLAEFSMAPKFQKSDDGLYTDADRADIVYNGFVRLLVQLGYSKKEALMALQDIEQEPVLRVYSQKETEKD